MVDITRFKNKKVNIERLVTAAKADSSQKSKKDERFWQPTVDAAGNGYAVIRFLPTGEDDLWVRYWDHAFQGPSGQWFIEKSLTSIGKDCPISESNSILWNSGNEASKELARNRKRRLHYVANILVINDQGNPANNGKVFLYSFGKKIFDKILESMNPEFPDETPVNPFDLWEGADFQLKIRNVASYRNYDKSEFKKPSPVLGGDDEKIGELLEGLFPLAEFIDPANYKSYDELQKRLNTVLGESKNNAVMSAKIDSFDDDIPFDTKDAKKIPSKDVADGDASEAEDAMAYFNRIAEEG
jgi:gp32 DNA binding protein like